MTSYIELSRGFLASIDDEDTERVCQYKWSVIERPGGIVHAHRKSYGKTLYLHHFILEWVPVSGLLIDHIDNDGLNNQKNNLRIATRRTNALNSNRSRNAIGYEKHGNKYRVRPYINGTRINIGVFNSEEEALTALKDFTDGL